MKKPKPKKPVRSGVGMPAHLWLEQFGSMVWDAFGEIPYLVGSSLTGPKPPRDVDVRLILDDEMYEKLIGGRPEFASRNKKWVALCTAFSALGTAMTGLPIDFQIQQLTDANQHFPNRPRSALGYVPARFTEDGSTLL